MPACGLRWSYRIGFYAWPRPRPATTAPTKRDAPRAGRASRIEYGRSTANPVKTTINESQTAGYSSIATISQPDIINPMTREDWLNEAITILDEQLFKPALSGLLPDRPYRVSCGFPGGPGKKKGVLGQCWNPAASADATTEMYISPVESDPVEVLDTLTHENVHRIVGCEHGHKAVFKRLALKVGLEGKMTSTTAGPELKEKLTSISEQLGEYPHAKVTPGEGKKKQSTRMLKIICPDCPNIARQSHTQFMEFGLICPPCERLMIIETADDV